MTVTVEFVSAEELAKVSADLRAMAEEQKRPLPRLVELAMATHNVALQKDPTWLSSFAWAAAVDAIIEECATAIEDVYKAHSHNRHSHVHMLDLYMKALDGLLAKPSEK